MTTTPIEATDTCTLCSPADHTVESHPECDSCGGTWMPLNSNGDCGNCVESALDDGLPWDHSDEDSVNGTNEWLGKHPANPS